MKSFTVNPLYTDTWYNDKIRYTDNLTSMETLSKEVTLFDTSSNIRFGYLLELPHQGDSNKYLKYAFYEEIRMKHGICCNHSVY